MKQKKVYAFSLFFLNFACSTAAETSTQKFISHYTIETSSLKIIPTCCQKEFEALRTFSKNDEYSAIAHDLSISYRLPPLKKEDNCIKITQYLQDQSYYSLPNLPFLFTAYLKDSNEIIGFYTYFPAFIKEETSEASLEQRTLIDLNFRGKGLGTELRRAMINNFTNNLYGKEFYLLNTHKNPDHPFKKYKIVSLIAAVELLNFPSIVSNLKVPFSLTHHDGDSFTAPTTVFFGYPALTKLRPSELINIYETLPQNPHFETRKIEKNTLKYGLKKMKQYLPNC